jgi:hypothetical protein
VTTAGALAADALGRGFASELSLDYSSLMFRLANLGYIKL